MVAFPTQAIQDESASIFYSLASELFVERNEYKGNQTSSQNLLCVVCNRVYRIRIILCNLQVYLVVSAL